MTDKILKNTRVNIFKVCIFIFFISAISGIFLVKVEAEDDYCRDPVVCTCSPVSPCTCPDPPDPDDPLPPDDPPQPPIIIPPCKRPPCMTPLGGGSITYNQDADPFNFLALVKNSIPKVGNNSNNIDGSNVLGSCTECSSINCTTDKKTCVSSGRECRPTAGGGTICWTWSCPGDCYGGPCSGGPNPPENPDPNDPDPDPNPIDPKGWHDGSSCDLNGKISSWGWSCDEDDYDTPLSIHIYKDGKAGSGGTFIASGIASGSRPDVGGQCGGTTNHGFNITTLDSFPAGTYSIYAYGINIGSTGSNKILSGSPKTVTCTTTNNSPGGNFDHISCTNGKIKISGWACDADDYTKPLSIHAYIGGPAGTGNMVGNFVANLYRPDNPWNVCGGNRNHGFSGVELSGTYTGKQTVYPYAINIGPTGENKLLASSPKEVDCGTAQLDPIRLEGIIWSGSGLDWPNAGESWKGKQPLSCTNKYHPNFQISTNRTTGNQIKDWWCHSSVGQAYYSTEYNIEKTGTFNATLSGLPLNHIVDKWIYKTSSGNNEKSGVFPGGTTVYTTDNLTLSPLDGWMNIHWRLIDCSGSHWEDDLNSCSTMCGPGVLSRTCISPDPRCPASTCDPNIPPTPCNNTPDKSCKYTLKVNVKEIPNTTPINRPEDCPGSLNKFSSLKGANVGVSKATDQPPQPPFSGGSAKSNDQGIALIENIPFGVRRLSISGSLTSEDENTPETYAMVCPSFSNYTYPVPPALLPYLLGGSIPAGNPYPTTETSIGLQKRYKASWLSVIDADMFSTGLDVPVPLGNTNNSNPSQTPQGFAKVLLNTVHPNAGFGDDLMLGYSFVENPSVDNPDVNAAIPRTKLSEVSSNNTSDPYQYGGVAYNLTASGNSHKSKWLEKFSFNPPSSAMPIKDLPKVLTSASVYKIEADSHTGKLEIPNTGYNYTIEGDKGPVIIYVDGNLDIKGSITTTSNQRILFVVNGQVDVSSSVGTPAISFNMSQNPNVMAGILANGRISINKDPNRDISAGKVDIPVMLSAPLVSKTDISFQRDLGHQNNATMPGQSVKQYNKFLYEIAKLEREKGFDDLYFTGVTTFDLDWEYIY